MPELVVAPELVVVPALPLVEELAVLVALVPLVLVDPVVPVLDDDVPFVVPAELLVLVQPVLLRPDVLPPIEVVADDWLELVPLAVEVLPDVPLVPPGSAQVPLSDEQTSNAGQTTQALPPRPQFSASGG